MAALGVGHPWTMSQSVYATEELQARRETHSQEVKPVPVREDAWHRPSVSKCMCSLGTQEHVQEKKESLKGEVGRKSSYFIRFQIDTDYDRIFLQARWKEECRQTRTCQEKNTNRELLREVKILGTLILFFYSDIEPYKDSYIFPTLFFFFFASPMWAERVFTAWVLAVHLFR